MIEIKTTIKKGNKNAIINTNLENDNYNVVRITTEKPLEIITTILSNSKIYLFLNEELKDDEDVLIELTEKIELME